MLSSGSLCVPLTPKNIGDIFAADLSGADCVEVRLDYRTKPQESIHTRWDRLPLPEYGVATLLATGGDGPLVDPALAPEPLAAVAVPAGARSVRELPVGALIGRRAQLRAVMGVLLLQVMSQVHVACNRHAHHDQSTETQDQEPPDHPHSRLG